MVTPISKGRGYNVNRKRKYYNSITKSLRKQQWKILFIIT